MRDERGGDQPPEALLDGVFRVGGHDPSSRSTPDRRPIRAPQERTGAASAPIHRHHRHDRHRSGRAHDKTSQIISIHRRRDFTGAMTM